EINIVEAGAIGLIALSFGYIGVSLLLSGQILPAIFVIFVGFTLAKEIHILAPYIQFHLFDWLRGLIRIIKTAPDYKYKDDPVVQEKLKVKRQFFYAYFFFILFSNLALVALSFAYGMGVLPLYAWGPAIIIMILTMRESIRSWWYQLAEAVALKLQKRDRWHTLKFYSDIGKSQLDRMRGDSLEARYLRDVFEVVVVEGSLRRHYFITEDEAKALLDAVDNSSASRLPHVSAPRARAILIEFFNKVEMFKKGELGAKIQAMDLDKLPPVIFKGTGKKRVYPLPEFLDAETATTKTTKEKVKVMKSPFRISKEQFGYSWRNYLAESFGLEGSVLGELTRINLSFADTIQRLSEISGEPYDEVEAKVTFEWIIFRIDGYLKTQIYSQEAGELAFRVLLKHKLGHEPTDEEIYQHMMVIANHSDLDPDNLPDGSETDKTSRWLYALIQRLGNYGWTLNRAPGDGTYRILVSNGDSSDPDNPAYYGYDPELGGAWNPKSNYWSVTARFIEGYLRLQGKDDAMVLNSDRDHFFYPSEFFLMPFVSERFGQDERLGWMCTDLRVFVDGFMPAASDHRVADDNWNTREIPAEAEIGMHAFYGPGIVRWGVMRGWACYMDNIEDTGGAIEALKGGWGGTGEGWYGNATHWISWGRPREMIVGSMPAFQNRFGGLVTDAFLGVHFQELLLSDQLHWTEKLTLFENFDFYFNKPLIPRYNLLIFLFAFFLSWTPYAYLAAPLFFISLQYVLAQAITAGGPRLFINQVKSNINLPSFTPGFISSLINSIVGYFLYLKRFWSLVFTFLPFIPMHDEKVRNAFKGQAGIFSSGIKDIYYPMLSFKELFVTFRSAIRWGILLLFILGLSSAHPYAVAGQIFFYVFPFAFIFGPFMKNGYSKPLYPLTVLGLLGAAIFGPASLSLPFAVAAVALIFFAGLVAKERYTKGIVHGLFAIVYFFWDSISSFTPKGFVSSLKGLVSEISKALKDIKGEVKNKAEPLFFRDELPGGHISDETESESTLSHQESETPDSSQEETAVAEIKAIVNQILQDSLADSHAPPRVEVIDYRYIEIILDKEIPDAQQQQVAQEIRRQLDEEELKIEIRDAAGKIITIPSQNITIRFGSIHIEVNTDGLDLDSPEEVSLTHTASETTARRNVALEKAQPEPILEAESVTIPAEEENRTLLLSVGANPDTQTFERLIHMDSDLLKAKVEFLLSVKERGLLGTRDGNIAVSLLKYSTATLRMRASVLEERGRRVNTYTIGRFNYLLEDSESQEQGSADNPAASGLNDADECSSADDLAQAIESLDLSRYEIGHKFMLYSAAPGTGKGTLWGKFQERFGHLTSRLMLYHTRNPRVKKGSSEKDGVAYHFRDEAELLELEREGKIVTTLVNNQLQGLPLIDFEEERIIEKSDLADDRRGIILPTDEIVRETEDTITVLRKIRGIKSVFEGDRLVVLEGGYGWFYALKKDSRFRERFEDVLVVFLSPYKDAQLQVRAANTRVIDSAFSTPGERSLAYRRMFELIQENKREIDLTREEDFLTDIRAYVAANIASLSSSDVWAVNASCIESDTFINDVFVAPSPTLSAEDKAQIQRQRESLTYEDRSLIKAMAYEVYRRLCDRDGDRAFSLSKESDPKGYDRYQRVLEGVRQILWRNQYVEAGGRVFPNPWAWENFEGVMEELTEKFSASFFEHVLRGINQVLKGTDFSSGDRNTDKLPASERVELILKYADDLRVEGDSEAGRNNLLIQLREWQRQYREKLGRDISLKDLLQEEYFQLIDEQGNLTGRVKPRALVHYDGDLHRDVRVFIVNEDGEVFVQKRGDKKDIEPGVFAESVGGHLGLGDDYLEALERECREELNVTHIARERLYHLGVFSDDVRGANHARNRSRYSMYVYVVTPEEEESLVIGEDDGIAGGRFVDIREVKRQALVAPESFTASFRTAFAENLLYTIIVSASDIYFSGLQPTYARLKDNYFGGDDYLFSITLIEWIQDYQ
ncbi:MAG: NUDIX domain-containing protein, partial [Candidatus Omnitrophica bacterium]|nr:NUDIX domain-containing protein [Candidatus Omnitrophota bacterium]MBD3269519.1 NUDIX domain-containing protein [Candidatus Omnitrophota bacterium]